MPVCSAGGQQCLKAVKSFKPARRLSGARSIIASAWLLVAPFSDRSAARPRDEQRRAMIIDPEIRPRIDGPLPSIPKELMTLRADYTEYVTDFLPRRPQGPFRKSQAFWRYHDRRKH